MNAPQSLLNCGKVQSIQCMLLHNADLYYSLSPLARTKTTRGEIWRLSLQTQKRELVASFPSGIDDFGFDGAGQLYAMDRVGKQLYWLNPKGSVEVLVPKLSNSIHFACAGDYLAWGGAWSGKNAVFVTRKDKIAPRAIASGFGPLTSLRADTHGVVFSTNSSAKRSGALYFAAWQDTTATCVHDGMRFCRRAERVGETFWFSAYYDRPPYDGLYRMRVGEAPTLVVEPSDPRGFRVESDRVVCGEHHGEVVEYQLDGSAKVLATLDQSILQTVVTDAAVFVATSSGELFSVVRE